MKRLMITVILLAAVAGCIFFVISQYSGSIAQTKALQESRNQAAARGIEWLIRHKDILPARDSFLLFGQLYKVVPDEATAQSLLTIAKEKGAQSAQEGEVNTPVYQSNSITRRNAYYTQLKSLLKRKCLGENIDSEISNLTKDLSTMLPIGNLEMWYVLNEFGLRDDTRYNQEISDTYTHYLAQPDDASEHFLEYYVTHVLLYESDYFAHRLDPNKFTREADILMRYIHSIPNTNAVIRANIDVLSEALYSLQLLDKKSNRTIHTMYKGLIEVQNEDGSWSQREGDVPMQFHNTAVAVLALTSFPEEPRSKKLYCLPY